MKFNKLGALALSVLAVGALASCGPTPEVTPTPTPTPTEVTPTQTQDDLTGVMSYAEYVAAEEGTVVTIAGYVQAKQSWWSNKATVYLQDDNGAYFLYELTCTEEQYNTDLAIGKRVKVTGVKGSWAGMVEILGQEAGAEATYVPLSGTKVYDAKAQTSLDDETLIPLSTQKVSFANLTVVSVSLPESEGKDIYFDVTDGKTIKTFAVESYLTDKNTDVYKTALTLKAGDVINCEGFMYVYYSAQLHTTSLTKTGKNVLAKSEGVMTYEEFVAAELDDEVTIEGFVQAKQAWWSNKATIYLQDADGGYFAYELTCTEEQYNTDLAIGKKVRITGIKGAWAGMVEILGQVSGAEAEYVALEGVYLAPTLKLELSDDLVSYSTQKVSFSNLTVVSVELPESEGKDIYFDVTDGKTIKTFAVESYLTDKNTDVYKTALTLKAGDVINCEGFMYVYYSGQLHTTSLTKTGANVLTKSEGTMTYEQYVAAEVDDEVTIEGFVQAKQAWWSNKATVYLQDEKGAYFVYELTCTEEQYNTDLAIGKKIKVTGIKGEWAGMVEILGQTSGAEAEYVALDGVWAAPTKELELSDANLVSYSTQKVSFSNLTVVSVELPESDGKDIYFDVTDGTTTLTFAVESYLTDKNTDVYKTVLALQAGDKINCEGFMYVYNNAQLHTTSVTVVQE